MADYDLSQTIIPFLDRHLALSCVAYLQDTGIFPANEILAALYELTRGTNMLDFAANLHQQLYPDEETPPEYDERRQKAVLTLDSLQLDAQAVLDVIGNPEVAQSLRQDKAQNLQFLSDNYNLNTDQIKALYNIGQFSYSVGNYSAASEYLYHYRILATDPELTMSAHWGKLAADILSGKFESAAEELVSLRDLIDARAPTSSSQEPALIQLHSRTWLAHWSLFVYFNHPTGRSLLLENFLSPTYLNTIQTSCPWILRYIAAAAILSRNATSSSRVRHSIREVVKVIQMEEYQYADPVTNFLKELYVEFDFESAQRELGKAEKVVKNDFFLNEFATEFLENARYLITDAYCRIHQKIDIGDLSDRLNLSREEGEKWIVNLIRETRMGADAKIDLEKNLIQITRPPQPVYQTVIEKTRGLALRSQALGAAMTRAPTAVAGGAS